MCVCVCIEIVPSHYTKAPLTPTPLAAVEVRYLHLHPPLPVSKAVDAHRLTTKAILRAVLTGCFFLTIREMYFVVFMKKNVVIIVEHSLPCNAPSIVTTTTHSKGYALLRD